MFIVVSGTVYFDATGTAVKEIPDNKRVLHYSMIPAELNVPVLEFLITQHTTDTIAYLLELFLGDVNNGVRVKPQEIVVYFSYAIIDACMQAFNKCTIKTYLNLTMTVLRVGNRWRKLGNSRLFACVWHK